MVGVKGMGIVLSEAEDSTDSVSATSAIVKAGIWTAPRQFNCRSEIIRKQVKAIVPQSIFAFALPTEPALCYDTNVDPFESF